MPQTLTVGSRSLFVSITAWLFMLLAMLGSMSALVQYAGISALSGQAALAGPQLVRPLLTGWLLAYMPWVTGAGFALAVATLCAAIGLLMRRDAARRAFIALLLVAIVLNLGGLWLQLELMLSLVDNSLRQAVLPPQLATVFGGFVVAARSMAVAFTLAACAVLGLIAWRLTQPMIRQEFA